MSESTESPVSKCTTCGFEAGEGEWETIDHPTLGSVTQCPECGSTDVHVR